MAKQRMPAAPRPVGRRSQGLRSANAGTRAPRRSVEEMEATSTGAEDYDRRQDEPPALDEVQVILRAIKRNHEIEQSATWENRKRALEDDKFRNLEQWDPLVKQAREANDEPCLVIDGIGGPILQITNQHRDSRPGIKVSPKGGRATKKLADRVQGLIRQIEYDSYATAVYANAFDQAVTGGWGNWRVNVEYASDTDNDLELKIARVPNRFSVYRDPTATEPDKSDARWVDITDDIPLGEYRELYPNSRVTRSIGTASFEAIQSEGDMGKEWLTEETVRVVEHWFKKRVKKRLLTLGPDRMVLTDDLSPATSSQATGAPNYYQPDPTGPRLPILFHRDLDAHDVYWCKANAVELLEGDATSLDEDGRVTKPLRWPGRYIPIVEMVGEEFMVGDKVTKRGLVRRARDSQIMLNTEASDMVLTQIRSPKHVWSGYVGQFGSSVDDPLFKQWMNVHRMRLPFVQAQPVEFNGQLLPPPALNTYEPPIQHLVLGLELAGKMVKDTTGYHEAGLGDLSPQERSGRAIAQLQRATEQGTSHYSFNFGIALQFTGRILVDLIPFVYDRPGRLVRLLGADDEEDAVLLKTPFTPGPDGPVPITPPAQFQVGRDEYVDFSNATFSVSVVPGKSYATRRQETSDALGSIAEAAPQLAPVIAPSWVRNLDFPGSDDLADILENAQPPHLRKPKPGQAPIPPEVMQQMEQAQKVIDMLTAEVTRLQQEQDAKLLEVESKERIAGLNAQVKLVTEQLKQVMGAVTAAQSDGRARAAQEFDAAQAAANDFASRAHERVMASDAARNAKEAGGSANGGGGGV